VPVFTNNTFSCTYNGGGGNGAITGELFNYVCNALGQEGANCSTISANGTTGTYGILSDCDTNTQLSWAFSYYYELSNRNPDACDFAGNATAHTQISASQANQNAASCLASVPSGGVFTPTATSGAPFISATTTGSGGGSHSGAISVEGGVLGGLFGTVIAVLIGAVAVLI